MSPVEMAMLGVNTPENEAALREFEDRKAVSLFIQRGGCMWGSFALPDSAIFELLGPRGQCYRAATDVRTYRAIVMRPDGTIEEARKE
jgi:hypothetical protein